MKILALFVFLATTAIAADFDRQALSGSSWRLLDESKIEEYYFMRSGYVTATIGTRDKDTITITAPLYSWKIEKGHLVIFSDDRIERFFTLVKQEKEKIWVHDKQAHEYIFEIIKK